MDKKALGLLAVGMIVVPIIVNAQSTTYTYQGAAFVDGGLNIPAPPGSTSVSVPPNIQVDALNGFITLSAPLGDNLNNVTVTPTFVDILSGSSQFSSALFKGVFAFSTNASGAIDGWSMSLDGSVPGPGGYTLTATSVDMGGQGGDSAALTTHCTAFFPQQPPQSFSCGSTGSNKTPGVWTSPTAQAPEIDPASAAGGLTLLLGALAVLRGRPKQIRSRALLA